MNFELRIAELERRMTSYESVKTHEKRKADVLEEDGEDLSASMMDGGGAAGVVDGGVGLCDSEDILKGVLRHSKPLGEFEWARKQINLTQTDPADLDRYFTALIASLVVCGYLDSYTAWMNRFVAPPAPPTGVLKGRPVEAYVSKNLLTMLNLQPLSRGRKAKEDGLATLKKRSTYEKVMECARAVARGETLSYEPSPAALQLEVCPPSKKKKTEGKKKLFTPPPPVESEGGEDDAVDAAAEEEDDAVEDDAVEEEDDVEDDDEGVVDIFALKRGGMSLGKGKEGSCGGAAMVAETNAVVEDDSISAATQVQEATQAESDPRTNKDVPVVEMQKVDLFSMPLSSSSSSSCATPACLPAASVVAAQTASSLRSRFMAKKTVLAPPHPMVQESSMLEWEPLDVNRRSMVQTPTGAWDSYFNWRKAFEADPRFENRYTEYTRPNGDRSSLTGYYVRFFNAWPTIVSADDIAVMPLQRADSTYVRWLQSLSTTKTTEELREKLL